MYWCQCRVGYIDMIEPLMCSRETKQIPVNQGVRRKTGWSFLWNAQGNRNRGPENMEKREIILGWGFVLHLGIEGRRGSRALSVVHSCVLPIVTPFSPSNHLSGTLPDESQPSCNVFSSIWHLVRAYQTSGQITGFLHRVVTFGSHACLVISPSGCLLQKPPGAERVKLAHDWWSLEFKKNKPCWT